MVGNNNVEPDVKKPEIKGCGNIVGWGCLVSIVLILAIGWYVMYSVSHNMKVRGANTTAAGDAKLAYHLAHRAFHNQ